VKEMMVKSKRKRKAKVSISETILKQGIGGKCGLRLVFEIENFGEQVAQAFETRLIQNPVEASSHERKTKLLFK